MWEKSIEFTHTQTSFPESLLLDELGRSPGLRLVVDLLILIFQNNGFVETTVPILRDDSLQLREQLWYLSKFPFNAILKNRNRNLNSGANVKHKLKTKQYFCKKQFDEDLL